MSKRSKEEKIVSVTATNAVTPNQNRRNRRVWIGGATALLLMIGIGAFAKNGWFPATDAFTQKKTGWFGKELPNNASSIWNPFAPPLPTATPQLSKEYVHAGSRLLAVVDANANETPPADLAVWRPGTGVWYVYNLVTTAWTQYGWGLSTDKPAQGDFDGDGKTDFAIYRPSAGEWWIVKSSDGTYYGVTLGLSTDVTAVADYDGDGKSDVAIYRPSTGAWYIYRSSDGSLMTPTFGISSDVACPKDFDGDGKADLAVWRGSNHTMYSANSTDSAIQTVSFGSTGDVPVPADYDGDGKANYAVRSGAGWVILNAARTSFATTTPSGDASTDEPVPNDYDGDGKVDIAVWRNSNGNWYIRKSGSSNALRQEAWGTSGDKPVAAYWRR